MVSFLTLGILGCNRPFSKKASLNFCARDAGGHLCSVKFYPIHLGQPRKMKLWKFFFLLQPRKNRFNFWLFLNQQHQCNTSATETEPLSPIPEQMQQIRHSEKGPAEETAEMLMERWNVMSEHWIESIPQWNLYIGIMPTNASCFMMIDVKCSMYFASLLHS